MPLFKPKEKVLIPPVTEGSGLPRSGYKSNAATYVPSRDGDPYSFPTHTKSVAVSTPDNANSLRDKYSRSNGVGDAYSRGDADIERDRGELFAGYKKKGESNRFVDGPQDSGQGNDEDTEGIKAQTRVLKQDSVNTTRNALRLAQEAEETARNTLTKLGDQSEKLSNTERHLDIAKGHSQRASDKADELKQLNRSIFRPVITFNKDAKRAAKEAKIQERYEEERLERERAMMDIRETQNRLGRAAGYAAQGDEEGISRRGRIKNAAEQTERMSQRKKYQFEGGASDDEMEDEIDDNLDGIGDVTKRLKALAMGMNQELDSQNSRIERIDDKALSLDNRVMINTERLKKIK